LIEIKQDLGFLAKGTEDKDCKKKTQSGFPHREEEKNRESVSHREEKIEEESRGE